MIPYDTLIRQQLEGETPKEKFDKLVAMQKLLKKIAYPRRGTEEETLTIFNVADEIIKNSLVQFNKEY